jgi:hypothetical protein
MSTLVDNFQHGHLAPALEDTAVLRSALDGVLSAPVDAN